MKPLFFIFIISFFSLGQIYAQEQEETTSESNKKEKSKRRFSLPKEKIKRAPIEQYKIITQERDTTYLDTTLTIQKEYKYNYLRRDDFELIPFVNVGSPYVQLAKQKQEYRAFPKFGATARSLAFIDEEDVFYYQSPTPLTDLYYKTVLEQGQQLNSFITINTAPNLNFSLGYNGIRSLGLYRNELTSTTAFKGTLSYHTKNERYFANAHFVDQTIINQENGGLITRAIEDFEGGNQDFENRAVLEINFDNASNELEGKRLFLDHEFRIIKKDSLQKNQLAIAHRISNATKEFKFIQNRAEEDYFGNAQIEGEFDDKHKLEYTENSVGIRYDHINLGKLEAMAKHSFFKYSYNSIFEKVEINEQGDIVFDDNGNTIIKERIINQLADNLYGFTGSYENTYKGFLLNGEVASTFVGDYLNQNLYVTAGYHSRNIGTIQFGYQVTSEAPEINKLLNQSNYFEYNWQNDFENTVTNSIIGKIKSRRFFDAEVTLSNINNYTYFSRVTPSLATDSQVQITDIDAEIKVSAPTQANESLQLLKVKVFKEFSYRKFRLANTVLFQQVSGNTNDLVYNVPQIVTRNTFYYQTNLFKKAMFAQIGGNFKYYTEYYTDGYDPLLGENFTQNTRKFGGYPIIDLFLNAKVRQTRIFFKLENAQNIFEQNKELLAPGTPTRDFLIRFGVVWNFFL